MDAKTTARDEYLHEPPGRRLWNESYFFDFNTDEIRGFTRLGFLPSERRANAWFYAVHDGDVYWYRDENIPIEDCFGLSVDTGTISQSYVPERPYEEWSVRADGRGQVATDPEGVLTGGGEGADIAADLTFTDPLHEALDIDLLVDSQHHYDHAGRMVGEVVLDGERVAVDGVGYRDHSWGWYRDWTPGSHGHMACFAQFPSGDCFTLIASTDPEDAVRHPYGYHATAETARPIEDASVAWNDGYGREERAEAWARGDFPDEVVFTIEFEDGVEELHCAPHHNVPIGYEDRNWALTDTDGPWLKSIVNRMPATCEWRGQEGHAWPEELLPI
jgi:hypothetical protein